MFSPEPMVLTLSSWKKKPGLESIECIHRDEIDAQRRIQREEGYWEALSIYNIPQSPSLVQFLASASHSLVFSAGGGSDRPESPHQQ